MKHYFLFLIGLLLSIHSLNTYACDAIFDGGMVRYNWSYNFFDDFIAPNKDSFMNTYSIDYITPQFLDTSGSVGLPFDWTQTLKNNLYKVPANTRMRVLENGTNKLRIAGVPSTRTNGTTSSYDFGIKYTIAYDYSNNYPNASDDISHQECVYYSVSWCGDGVIDSSFSETCDNGAGNGTAGNSCSSTCTTIVTPASCTSGGVTGSQTSAISSTTPNLCQAGVTVGNFTSNVSGNTINYSWSCGGLTGGNCSASYTPSGGGGGSTPVCNSLTQTQGAGNNYSFTCNSNSSQYTIDINQLNADGTVISPKLQQFTNGGGSYNFTSVGTYKIQCYVGVTNTSSAACTKTITISPGPAGGGSCGNGIRETGETCETHSYVFVSKTCPANATHPNPYECGGNELKPASQPTGVICRSNCTYCGDGNLEELQGEECDFGTNTWENWCTQGTCQINDTIPSGGNISFFPKGEILLGHNMSIFGNLPSPNIKITNTSTSDVYINKKMCTYKNSGVYNVISGTDICGGSVIGKINKGGGSREVAINDNFMTSTNNLGTATFGTGDMITTLEGYKDTDTFLKAILHVKVAKSTVSTLGGGASLLNGMNFSDINTLSSGGFASLSPAVNKNMILSSVGVQPLSSFAKSSNNTTLVNISQQQGNAEINNFSGVTANTLGTSINSLPTDTFNGFENVFTYKGTVHLSAQSISGGNKTYVIEGDLDITGNITSSDNILFVVKNGTITINNTVTNIDAIIINIGGDINGETTPTLNRLVVNGALYGNVSDLLSKRTYIKNRGDYVDVGTNINFTSKIFNSPPPLLSSFLGEYSASKKIPQ